MSEMDCKCKNGNHKNCSDSNCDCRYHEKSMYVDLDKEKPREISDTRPAI